MSASFNLKIAFLTLLSFVSTFSLTYSSIQYCNLGFFGGGEVSERKLTLLGK